MTPASYMVYLSTPPLLKEPHTFNTNYTLASMSKISYLEYLFKTLLQYHIQVDFIGNVDYLLGNAFIWLQRADGEISVYLCQSTFTEVADHRLSVHTANKVPNMNPYRSGLPIDYIPPVNSLDPDLLLRKQVYQSIVGCINWLATCMCPDISPALILLASYSNAPHPQHYKSIVHALKYLTSPNEYSISLHSKSSSTIQ